MPKPPVIFYVSANDRQASSKYLRNLPEEMRAIRNLLDQAKAKDLCEPKEISNATVDDIRQVLLQEDFRDRVSIFHFCGHAGSYELLLEDAKGTPDIIDAGGFAKFLGRQKGLEIVFLNGCSTDGHVQSLLGTQVSAVISTSQAIKDEVARDFAVLFYRSLVEGANLEMAFEDAVVGVELRFGGKERGFVRKKRDVDEIPWRFHVKRGAEQIRDWNLPEVVADPLFGLPDVEGYDLPVEPYPHLKWYTEKDAPIFFGRGREIRKLYTYIISEHTSPIILLYGQSGVGKSSLLEAGVLPRLKHQQHVHYLRRDPGLGLLGTVEQVFSANKNKELKNSWISYEEEKAMTLILDQVEELFTNPAQQVRLELAAFGQMLEQLWRDKEDRPKGKLVLGIRKEYAPEIAALLKERGIPFKEVFVRPLDEKGIIEAVVGISSEKLKHQYNLSIHPYLAGEIASDLLSGEQFASIAPTLQILLHKLWTQAKKVDIEEPHFSKKLYRELKGKGLLLKDFLDEQLLQLNAEFMNSGLALDVLYLHTTQLGTASHLERTELNKIYSHVGLPFELLIAQLEDAYLLLELEGKTRLAHDTLAPLVIQRYNESDSMGQRARRILDSRLIHGATDLEVSALDEADLTIVEAGKMGMSDWNDEEKALVEKSLQLRELREKEREKIERERNEAREAEIRHEQEIAESERKKRRIFQVATVVASVVLVGVAWLSWRLNETYKEKNKLTQTVQGLSLTKDSLEQRSVELTEGIKNKEDVLTQQNASILELEESTKSLQLQNWQVEKAYEANKLALEANELLDSGNKYEAIRSAVNAYNYDSSSSSAQNALLRAVYDEQPIVKEFDKETYDEVQSHRGDQVPNTNFFLNTLEVRDKTGKPRFTYEFEEVIRAVSPINGYKDRVYVELRKGPEIEKMLILPWADYAFRANKIQSFAYDPYRDKLMLSTENNEVTSFKLNEEEASRLIKLDVSGDPGIKKVDIHPDLQHYMLISSREIRIYPPDLSHPISKISANDGDFIHASFSYADPQVLASIEDNGHIQVWNWNTNRLESFKKVKLGISLSNSLLIFSPEERYILAGGSTGKLWIWDWRNNLVIEDYSFESAIHDIRFSPDGRWLAIATASKGVFLYPWNKWEQSFQSKHWKKISDGVVVNAIAFGKNKQGELMLATGAANQFVRVYKISGFSVNKFWSFPTGALVKKVVFAGEKLIVGDDQGIWRPFDLSPQIIIQRLIQEQIINP